MSDIQNDIYNLQMAIATVAKSWIQLNGPGDPNIYDVHFHARKVVEHLGLQIPKQLPNKRIGVSLVESVEDNFIKGSLIRHLSSEELVQRGNTLAKDIQNQKLLSFEIPINYVVSLYSWNGCLCMAKLTRETYVTTNREQAYTDEMRINGYKNLENLWKKEEQDFDNPWIRYGVSLAKTLSEKRGNKVINNWIPKDSPY